MGALDRLDRFGDGRIKAEGLLNEVEVIVNGLGDADYPDIETPSCDLPGNSFGRPHRPVSPNAEQEIYVHPFEGIDHLADVLAPPG